MSQKTPKSGAHPRTPKSTKKRAREVDEEATAADVEEVRNVKKKLDDVEEVVEKKDIEKPAEVENVVEKENEVQTKKKIYFVTGNQGKKREMQEILKDIPIDLDFVKVDLPELQGTVNDVLREKTRLAFEKIKAPCFVDDTCLEFKAMKGLPGVYIKWFLDSLGNEGLNKMLVGFDDHSAAAVCTIGLATSNGAVNIFRGETEGTIVPPRGELGFGWDPIFEEKDSKKTYGEMTSEEKNAVSHRKRSVELLKTFLKENISNL